jgi:SP family sugar:H+ symporter-like MFS transporter
MTALRAGDENVARSELNMVRAEIEEEKTVETVSWYGIFTNPNFRNVVVIGCLTQFFQIITGINAIVSYGGSLFKGLGVNGIVAGLTPSIAFLVGNTIGAFGLVDRIGRRPLLIWGMVAMGLTLLAGGIIGLTAEKHIDADGEARISTGSGYAIIAMVVGYCFSFGISWGFGAWLYISEIMPLRVRGKAVGLCTGVNWGPANGLSAFVTPMMIAGPMGPAGALLFFGVVSVFVVPFAATCLPETSGKSLEEITPLFRFVGWDGFRHFAHNNMNSGRASVGNSETKTQTPPAVLLGAGTCHASLECKETSF